MSLIQVNSIDIAEPGEPIGLLDSPKTFFRPLNPFLVKYLQLKIEF
jgi:hypothetical protein